MNCGVCHQSIAAHDLLQPFGVSQPHHALIVAQLRAAIGMRLPDKSMPEIAPLHQTYNVQLNHHVGNNVPYTPVLQ